MELRFLISGGDRGASGARRWDQRDCGHFSLHQLRQVGPGGEQVGETQRCPGEDRDGRPPGPRQAGRD